MAQPIDPIHVLAECDDTEFICRVLLYLDGALDAEEVAALSEVLREDATKRDWFVAAAYFRQHLRRLGQGQASQPQAIPGVGEHADDLEVLLSHLPIEHKEGGYKLADDADDRSAPRPAVSRASPADGSPGGSGEKDVLLNFAGVYVSRRERSRTPSGGIKLKHLAAAACLLLGGGLAWLVLRPTPPSPPPPPVVATITGQRDAGWDRSDSIQVGTVLRAGDSFSVTSGLLQIQTQRGATVLAEAPSRVQLLDENRLLLERGKLVAQVPAQAHGFTVDTPTAQLIDLGTEFGIDVDAGSDTRTAVFDGKIVLAGQPGQSGEAAPPQLEVTVGRTARASTAGQVAEDPTPSAEFANSFRWSLDQQAIPDYVVAYWRFEEASPNQRMPHQNSNDKDRAHIAAKDWSGNDNHLYAFEENIAPWGSGAVPHSVVPGPRLFNLRSMRNYGTVLQTQCNLYTRGDLLARPAPLELEVMERWTIEASFNFASTYGTQALIAKQYLQTEDETTWLPNAGRVLTVHMRDGRIEVELIDDDGRQHTLTGAHALAANRWHHVAVVFDGDDLSLYVRSEGDPQYTQSRLSSTLGLVSLTLPEAPLGPISEQYPVEWNIGGFASKEHNALAMIDEVRISREALTPDRFLFASRSGSSGSAGTSTE